MKNELQKDYPLRRLRQERLIELGDGSFHKMTLADLKKILQESYSIKVIILLFLISVPAFCGIISEAVTKGSGDLTKVLNDIDNNVINASNIIVPVIDFAACLIAGGYFM